MSRIDIFKQMLETDPANSSVLFGLAKEYEKAGLNDDLIETLTRYLATSDDEGNAHGMLASAYERVGNREKAREAYQQGIKAALAHGHPSMAEEYRMTLASEYESDETFDSPQSENENRYESSEAS
jgi:predicted Zn-dependent protease